MSGPLTTAVELSLLYVAVTRLLSKGPSNLLRIKSQVIFKVHKKALSDIEYYFICEKI